MNVFQVIDQGSTELAELVQITDQHFGGNLLINYTDFSDPTSEFAESVENLGLKTVRYPGGSVTEQYFDVTNPDASSVVYQGFAVSLVPLREFMDYAAEKGVSATVVIPTIDGLTASAEEALLDGSYGDRGVNHGFVADAAAFATEALRQAQAKGVKIEAFEIGNEFWGSGKMSAAEYGRLAADLSVSIDAALHQAGFAPKVQPNILVQGTAATAKYSPTPASNDDMFIYEMADGSLWSSPKSYAVGDLPSDFNGTAIAIAFGNHPVPNQGWLKRQNAQIMDAIVAKAGAADAIDGIVLHYYGDADIDVVDTQDNRLFGFLRQFDGLGDHRSDHLPPLLRFVTEWNIRGGETHLSSGQGGMIQAQYLLEMFYQMATHGIDAAHIWPVRNEGFQLSSTIDVNGEGLSVAGETFASMSDLLVGLTPSLDAEVGVPGGTGYVDIHGFEDSSRHVFYVSERAGGDGIATLDLTNVVEGENFYVSVMVLGAQGNPLNPNAEPVWSQNGLTLSGQAPRIDVMFSPYSIAVVELTKISEFGDVVQGRTGNDRIDGSGGNDKLFGNEGADTLYGGIGADELNGGVGDDVLYGQNGNDRLQGGVGTDALFGQAGDDLLLIDQDDLLAHGGSGLDTLSLNDFDRAASIWSLEGQVELSNWSIAFEGIEHVEGTAFGDRVSVKTTQTDFSGMGGNDLFEIWSSGQNTFSGDAGDDSFYVYGDARGTVLGGAGSDTFFIWFGIATYSGGAGDDTFHSFNASQDTFIFGPNTGNDIISGFDVDLDRLIVNGTTAPALSLVDLPRGTLLEFDVGGSVFLEDVFDASFVDDIVFN